MNAASPDSSSGTSRENQNPAEEPGAAFGPEKPRSARERLIVALDVPSRAPALALVEHLGDEVLWYKVGMELFYAEGGGLVEELAARGRRIFLDLKLHDIPNTMASALRSLSRLPVDLVTLHVPAGAAAMVACSAAVREPLLGSGGSGRPNSDAGAGGPGLPVYASGGRAPGDPRRIGLLGVTRLTSLPPQDPGDPWRDVVALAGEAVAAGLFGWIAPAEAASTLRAAWGSGPALVCPGIRLPEQGRDDQVATGTPEGAIRGGADWIVVGRPVTRADDPRAAARAIVQRLG